MQSPLLAEINRTRTLITGAGRGLGREIARALDGWGARVAVADIDSEAAEETASIIGSGTGAWTLDVTDETSVDPVVDSVADALGGIDLLVNNAGVLTVANVVDLNTSEWRRVLDVNLTGTFLCARAAARRMRRDGTAGSIVSIASIAGKVGDPGLAHYSASKFGVVGFTQALARELAEDGITVNAVCPGLVDTPMIERLAAEWGTNREGLLDLQLVKRPQTGEEIASAIAFLHSNRSITGQSLNVDGGTIFH